MDLTNKIVKAVNPHSIHDPSTSGHSDPFQDTEHNHWTEHQRLLLTQCHFVLIPTQKMHAELAQCVH